MGNAKFRFQNPNEKGRCGCGESFYVEGEEAEKVS
jgi:Fe-S cluster assembly iron-binding protein IscA